MQTLTEIKSLLAERGVRPKHRLGQNFLHDHNLIRKLVDAANVRPGEIVLEVGPGTGTLTSELLERGARVVACELDRDMAAIMESVFADELRSNLTLVQGDALAKDRRLNPALVDALGSRPFKLVANLPYQAASPLISALLIGHPAPECTGQFITIQREVADRLLARAGTKEYGPLTIIVQSFAEVKRIATVSPSCFWPQPDVTSAMVAIKPKGMGPQAPGDSASRRAFARFITSLFTKRRKQLGTIFGRERAFWPRGVNRDQRPEVLGIDQLRELWTLLDQPQP